MKTIIASLILSSAAYAQLSFNAGVTSDYIARGTSQTLGGFAYSFGADYAFKNGAYVGTWTSNVDFGDGTDQEVDGWVGYRHTIIDWNFDYSFSLFGYLGDPVSYEMVEGKIAVSRSFGKFTFTEVAAYSPDYFNILDQSLWLESSVSYQFTDKISLSGGVGHQYIEGGGSYGCWNFGVGYKINDNFFLDVRYSDTNDHAQGKAWENTVSVSLKTTF